MWNFLNYSLTDMNTEFFAVILSVVCSKQYEGAEMQKGIFISVKDSCGMASRIVLRFWNLSCVHIQQSIQDLMRASYGVQLDISLSSDIICHIKPDKKMITWQAYQSGATHGSVQHLKTSVACCYRLYHFRKQQYHSVEGHIRQRSTQKQCDRSEYGRVCSDSCNKEVARELHSEWNYERWVSFRIFGKYKNASNTPEPDVWL